jgi:hypothetical protein
MRTIKITIANAVETATQIIKDFTKFLARPNDGVILKDLLSIKGCEVILSTYKQDPEHIWVSFISDNGDYSIYTASFPNTHKGYDAARNYFVKTVASLKTIRDPKRSIRDFFTKHAFAMARSVQAFEDTLVGFEQMEALAYNMKQTKTRMSKEQINARIVRHKEMIKNRKDKIKIWEKQKKAAAMNPERVQKISARITKQGDRIAKHTEALKYYKMLGAIKPPKEKVNPANRGANKVINLRKKDMVK